MVSARRGRTLRILVLVAVGLAVVVGAAVLALEAHLSAPVALVTGLALGLGFSLTLIWWQERRRREIRRAEERAEEARRREASFRMFWQASADLAPDGWARRDLEALRLVARNLRPDDILGERMARRVREASSAALARVVDRLTDLALAGRRIGAPESRIEALETATGRLAALLEEARAVTGEGPPFDPPAVVRTVEALTALADELREAVRPAIVADLARMAERVAHEARRSFRHELRLNRGAEPARLAVAVRESDLEAAIAALLERLMSRGHVAGPVDLEVRHEGEAARVLVAWTIADRLRVDPEHIAQPLRLLAAYGAGVTVEENVHDQRITVELALPLAEARIAN